MNNTILTKLKIEAKKSGVNKQYACAIVHRKEIISVACNSFYTERCNTNKCCFLCV